MPSITGYFRRIHGLLHESRDFRWLLAAQAFSYLNVEVWYIVKPFLILQQSRSPLWMGLIATLGYLPSLVASSPAGWWVDRTSARKVLVASAAARSLLYVLLACLGMAGHLTLPFLAAACLVLGIFGVAQTTAMRTIIPGLVSSKSIPLANSLDESTLGFAEMFGTLAGGFGVALLGPYPTMLIQACLLMGCLLSVLRIEDNASHAPPSAGPRASNLPIGSAAPQAVRPPFVEGFSFLVRKEPASRILFSSLLIASVVHGCCMVFFSMQVFYYGSVLNLSSDTVGWMIFAISAMGLAASLMTERFIAHLGIGRAVLLFAAVVPAGLLLVAVRVHPAWVVCGAGLILAGGKSLRVARNTLCQQLAPRALLGRVNGAYQMFAEGVTPLASLTTGILAKSVGFPATYSIAGALGVAACLYYFFSPLKGLVDAHYSGPNREPAVAPLGDAQAA